MLAPSRQKRNCNGLLYITLSISQVNFNQPFQIKLKHKLSLKVNLRKLMFKNVWQYNLPIAMQLHEAWFTCDIFSILTQTDDENVVCIILYIRSFINFNTPITI